VLCCAASQWWQVDVGYYLICMLGWLGLAWDIKVPSPADKARKRKQTVVVKAD
jgi:stearoyl-CoA desaturase (delta-9 desaturase)